MDLYFSIGIPKGYTEYLDGTTFTPKLLSVSTLEVSPSGSTIQATIKGVGVNDEITLVNSASTGTSLCLSATVIEYGLLECVTDPAVDFSGSIVASVKEIASGTVHACLSTNTAQCTIGNLASQPAFDSVTLTSSSQLDLTGSLFPTSGFTCEVVYAQATSDTCTITSASAVTAIFTNGVGTEETAVAPVLRFIATDGTYSHQAVPSDQAVLANPLTVSSATSSLQSSFAGGSSFTVSAPGLT